MTVRPPPVVLLLGTHGAASRSLPVTQLIESGYQIADHRNQSDGLAVARKVRPDVVLVDVPDRDTSALDLCRRLQADNATRTIPIIAITGDPSVGQFMTTLSVRACDAATLHLEVARVLADRLAPPASSGLPSA